MMACLVKVCQSLLTIVTLSVIICASTQQVYHFLKSKSSLPFNALTCLSSPVSSLSECAFLAGESKTVTFFYNRDTYQCQWDCVFLFNGTCLTMCQSPWIPFGTFFFFKHFYITCIYYVKRSYLACKIHGPDRSGGAVG